MIEPKQYAFAPGTGPAATLLWLGFDLSSYPGDTFIHTWWASSPFYFCGFYLAPAPHHSNTSWMTKRSVLKGQGWGFLPIYIGRQAGDSNLNFNQGVADALDAASLAGNAGFPVGTYLFLDVETGGTLSSAFISYIKGFVQTLDENTIYWAGVYCSYYRSAAQIKTAIGSLTCRFWCWNVNCPPSPGCVDQENPPGNCGYADAIVWQYAQSPQPGGISCSGYSGGQCPRSYGGTASKNIDLDTSTSPNPSNG